ncbi:MAG TPA: sulfotransferase [Candidatus Polarisedimenticolia bacterium]|nr:sulfotransferase [Candidatus Polarisedimenticolia bacterium]
MKRKDESSGVPLARSARALAVPGRNTCRLDGHELCAEAQRKTGLKNFGAPAIDPAFFILAASLEREANLHWLGRRLMKIHLLGLLTARLKMAARCELRAGNYASSPSLPPIFITGMPRSGSTFLHELLAQDPSLRAPRVWEVMSPAEADEPDRGWHDSRVWQAAWCLWWFRRLAPRADAVYPMRARTPHECVAIQSYTFLSEEFISTCHIPSYEAFLRSTSLRAAYAWQKRFLNYLQCGRPPKRWILKSPDHVRGLEELFTVFPDALIIQTHRNPLDSLRSSIQLTEVLRRLYARPQPREELAEREARTMAWSVDRVIQFRDEHPELANRFVDVNYSELTSDPLAVVRRIYRRFEIPLSEAAVSNIRQLACSRSAYKGRRTAPTLVETGLDPRAHLKLFGEYCRRFGIHGGPGRSKLTPL